MQRIQFDYFHGIEAEQYNFYRVPKVLFTADYFKALTCEAKVLYGLMLDRMGLSIKNRWIDEEDSSGDFLNTRARVMRSSSGT